MENKTTNKDIAGSITSTSVDIRRAADGTQYIEGYAALWDDGTDSTKYKPLDHLTESVDPHAFDDILRSQNTIKIKYNHSDDCELGDTGSGTAFVVADDKGLKYSVPFDDTEPDHLKVKRGIEKKRIKGSSFHAAGEVSLKRNSDGTYHRRIVKVSSVADLGPVNEPAYKNAGAMLRKEIDLMEQTNERIERLRLL